MVDTCDVLVCGAGIVGLAVSRQLAQEGREVLVVERHDAPGTETSSRNSEVIHAGIYYPTNSLKAKFCVRGKHLLYEHCQRYSVEHEQVGKIIVATQQSHFDTLAEYRSQALKNGAGDLEWMSADDVSKWEPAVHCLGAIYSPTTGIIDSHGFMLSLIGDLEAHGGMIAYQTAVDDVAVGEDLVVSCSGFKLAPRLFVNAAGLNAPTLAQQLGRPYEAFYAKGHYYTLSGKSPFSRLIYPVAETGGLGVHVTLDISHQARFGPDVVWIDEDDYSFDSSQFDRFVDAIRRYYPDLDPTKLQPGYTGIRPKLAPSGIGVSDFVVNGPKETGIDGYIELLGIESPGLTAALAISEFVSEMAAAS